MVELGRGRAVSARLIGTFMPKTAKGGTGGYNQKEEKNDILTICHMVHP